MKRKQVTLIIKSDHNMIVDINAFYNKSYATSFFLKECTKCKMRPKELPRALKNKEYYTSAKSVSLRTIKVPTKKQIPLKQGPGVKVPLSLTAQVICWIIYIGLVAAFLFLISQPIFIH